MVTTLPGYFKYFDTGALSTLPANLQWYTLGIAASMTVITVYALLYALGHAFRMAELERHSKSEILNAIATALMVLFFIFVVGQMEEFSLRYFLGCQGGIGAQLVCPSFKCAGTDVSIDELKNSISLLQCRMSEKAQAFSDLQGELTSSAVSLNPFSVFNRLNFYVSIIGIPIFSGMWISPWFNEAEIYRLLNAFLTNMLIGINAMIVVGDYVKANMLSFFLPLGMILRSTPFTRGIGAFFMALAIGMYFVFPVLYIITDPGFVKPAYNPATSVVSGTPLCYPTFSSVSYSVHSSISSGQSSGGTQLSLSQLRTDLASIYVSILLQPFVVFAMTIVFVRYLTYIFGGEPADILRATAKVI